MNTIVTSQEAILEACRELVESRGLEALNIRAVAEKCGISVGAVYHYFPSKAELAAAAVAEIWRSIFHGDSCAPPPASFSSAVESVFESFRRGAEKYPRFFSAHSLLFAGSERDGARRVMEEAFCHMKEGLRAALHGDRTIPETAFSGELGEAEFVDFVFSALLALLAREKSSCGGLLELIRRTVSSG